MASDVIGVHDPFLGDTPLVEDSGALVGGSTRRDDWDGRLAGWDWPSVASEVEGFRCWNYESKMTALAASERRCDLTEVAVEAVPCLNGVLIGRLANAAWEFLVKKLIRDLVELHFRRSGEIDVLGCNGRCLSGQGDGCGDGCLLACGGQGGGVVNGRLLALGGDHVFGRPVGACRIFRWVLSLRARFNDVC